MSYILFVFFAASAWCFGLHVVMKKVVFAEILQFNLDENWHSLQRLTKLVLKPSFACPYCMASIWGTLIYAYYLDMYGIFWWPVFCICLCGFNYIISYFVTE
jgi:hypothetical protein